MTIKNLIKRFFKRRWLSFLIFLRKRATGDFGVEDQREYQKVCLSICRKLITKPDSKFLIAPISGKKYIKNERLGLFVIMHEQHINVTNHTYNYSVFVCNRDWERITFLFDTETERRRLEYENEIKSQITHSLKNILDRFTDH